MGNVESSKKSTTTKKNSSNGGVGGHQESDSDATVSAVGIAAGVIAVVGLLWKLFGSSGSSSGGKTMKAPGRDHRIFRSDFERDPAGYFRDLRK